MTELVYGKLRHREEYTLLEKEAGEKQIQAFDCSTWGEYARLAGMEWETFYEEWYLDIDDLRDEGAEGLTPETPFEVDWAKYRSEAASFAGLIRDPREKAYMVLPSDIDYSEHIVLDTDLNMGGASPGPNIGTVTADNPDTFKRLEDFLADKGYDEFSIEKDLDFVLDCYKGFH